MRQMTNLEYACIVQELRPLVGKHLENIYSAGDNFLRLKIGGKDIACEPGARLHLTKYIEGSGELTNFAKQLRKELENARLRDVYKHNDDRIIVFDFGGDDKKLVFEMFAHGNAILVKGETTIAALRSEEWSDRKIARNEQYKFPKSNIKNSVLEAVSSARQKYIAVALMQMPFGKEYVQEVLLELGIDEKKTAGNLSEAELSALETKFGELRSLKTFFGFYEAGRIADFGLVKFSKYSALEPRVFQSLSEAADEFYFHNKGQKNEKIEKLKRRLEEQESRLALLKEEEKQKKEAGDYIYQNYGNIERILALSRSSDINVLEEKLASLGLKAKVNKKDKEIAVELG